MARSRRSFSRRSKPDWVYRGNIYASDGGTIDGGGSYVAHTNLVTQGGAGATALILYDSHNYVKLGVATLGAGTILPMSQAGRAEGGSAFIHRVQGTIMAAPSVWAVGSQYRLGMRFGVFEQDPAVGLLLIDPSYNMWTPAANIDVAPATWANDRMWSRERRVVQTFDDNDQIWSWNFNFKVNRKLNPNQCYACYIETSSTPASVNLFIQPWLRTLVSDEG